MQNRDGTVTLWLESSHPEEELLLGSEIARQVVANPTPPKSDFLSKIQLIFPKTEVHKNLEQHFLQKTYMLYKQQASTVLQIMDRYLGKL